MRARSIARPAACVLAAALAACGQIDTRGNAGVGSPAVDAGTPGGGASPGADAGTAGDAGPAADGGPAAPGGGNGGGGTGGAPPPAHAVKVTSTGPGAVLSSLSGIDCGGTCSASFAEGTVVTLSARPDAGARFSGWGGACSGGGPCDLRVDRDLEVTATFLRQVKLAVDISGGGHGKVSFDGRACESDCDATYDPGSNVTLSASVREGSIFMGWTGACSGLKECVVRLDEDAKVGAIFWPFPAYTVTAFGDLFTSLGGIDDAGNVVFVRSANLVGDLAFYRDATNGAESQMWPGNDAWTIRISPAGRIALTTFRVNAGDDAWDSWRLRPGTRWTWDHARTLGGVDGAYALSVDDGGLIIGGAHVSGRGTDRIFRAYTEDGARIVDLGSSDLSSSATAHGGGLIIGSVWGSAFGPRRAAVWSDGIHEIGSFGGTYSIAYGINRHGAIVGTAQTSDGGFHAFLRDAQSRALRDLGPGEMLSINDDGVAVGSTEGGYPMPRGNGTLYFNGIVWNLNDLVQEPDTRLEGAMFVNSRGQIIGGGLVHNRWGDYLLTPRN